MGSLWYPGAIAEAITKAKNQGAIFIVFIQGNDDVSTYYEKLFTEGKVHDKLNTKDFVAIKLAENSLEHQQFSAIYPNNSIPSIFFIGKNGKSLEIVTEKYTENEFDGKIDSILQKAGIRLTGSAVTQESSNNATVSISEEQNNIPSTSETSTLTPEEKLLHARELIEQKREEKKRQEEEAERLKEIERRKMGQNVQQMKKWQKDEELRQMLEERNREKRENQAARDRVLAQIAQDKADRAAKFSKQTPPSSASVSPPASAAAPRSNVTRLQLRLPDGSSKTQEFQINNLFESVHQFIENEVQLPFSNYILATTFPRREFTAEDRNQSLLDLQLVPNAVILILPQMQPGTVSTNSGLTGLLWWLLAPIFKVYGYFVGYFSGNTATNGNSGPDVNPKRSASEMDDSQRSVPKRQASGSTVIRRQGNIHRLSDKPDTDDDNNTWNGNSTQQM